MNFMLILTGILTTVLLLMWMPAESFERGRYR